MAGSRYQFNGLVLLCFVLYLVCHAAGSSRGSRTISTYRSTRYSSGGGVRTSQNNSSGGGVRTSQNNSSGGGVSSDVGMIIGIVFGCIGAIIAIAVIAYLIHRFYCHKKASSSATPPPSGGKDEIRLSEPAPASKSSDGAGNQYTSGPQDDQYKSQFSDATFTPYPANPPSYNAAVTGDGSSLSYGTTPEYNSTPGYDTSPYPQTGAIGFELTGSSVDRKNV